jgi:hypothetical protein
MTKERQKKDRPAAQYKQEDAVRLGLYVPYIEEYVVNIAYLL